MTSKPKLPIEVHDHFRKANVLHGYVQTELGEVRDHALETGQELIAAKKLTPPGGWEKECERLFDGKLRTAQRYMQFAKHLGAIPKAHARALLMHEGTLEGAVKAAKAAAKPKPEPAEPIDVDSDPVAAQVQEAVASVVAEDSEDEDPGEEHAEETPATEIGAMSKIRELAMKYEPPAAMAAFLRGLADELS